MKLLRLAVPSALLLAALAARAGEPPADAPPAPGLEFQATLYQTDAKKFLEALGPKDGASIPVVFDRASSRDLSVALTEARRLTGCRKAAPPGKSVVLEASEQRKYVRDVDLRWDFSRFSAAAVEGILQWGFKAEVTPLAASEGRLAARVAFECMAPLKSKFFEHEGVRVELPALSAFGGTTHAVFPAGGSLAFGCVACLDPESLLVLVVSLSPDAAPVEVPEGRPELAATPVFSRTTWLLLHDRAALAKAASEAKGSELPSSGAAKLRLAGKLQALAFLPQAPGGASELHCLSQEAFVRDYEREEASEATAWDPVIGQMETGLRVTGREAAPSREGGDFDFAFELRACLLRQPLKTKPIERTRLSVLAPEFLEGDAGGTVATGAAERCFFFKAAGAGCPYAGTVIVSVKP
jgi:hypothetical protein